MYICIYRPSIHTQFGAHFCSDNDGTIYIPFVLQLDLAAPALAAMKEPIVIAKVNADKFTRLASKYDVEYDLCLISI